jgi:hypothetical protein
MTYRIFARTELNGPGPTFKGRFILKGRKDREGFTFQNTARPFSNGSSMAAGGGWSSSMSSLAMLMNIDFRENDSSTQWVNTCLLPEFTRKESTFNTHNINADPAQAYIVKAGTTDMEVKSSINAAASDIEGLCNGYHHAYPRVENHRVFEQISWRLRPDESFGDGLVGIFHLNTQGLLNRLLGWSVSWPTLSLSCLQTALSIGCPPLWLCFMRRGW